MCVAVCVTVCVKIALKGFLHSKEPLKRATHKSSILYQTRPVFHAKSPAKRCSCSGAVQTAVESKTFQDAETEVDNTWFVENAPRSSKKNSRGTAVTPAAGSGQEAGDRDDDADEGTGGLSEEEVVLYSLLFEYRGDCMPRDTCVLTFSDLWQAMRVLNKFKTLREKMYFMRVGFERDSIEFKSGIKESLQHKLDVQQELDLDVTMLRKKLDQMVEIARADRVGITEIEGKVANRMVLDLCDESICLIEHVGTVSGESPSRLACELLLDMDFEETVGNHDSLMVAIATDVARACGGTVDKIKVRGLRSGPVIADLILCAGLQEGKTSMNTFDFLKAQQKDPDSVLHKGAVTSKIIDLRLKKCYVKNQAKASANLKLLQGVPRMLLDLENVLEGIEGALADPVTLSNDPTMYAPDQDRPSSAVVAQLRPLLAIARMKLGAGLAENQLDFSLIAKVHNKFQKSFHESRDELFQDYATKPLLSEQKGARQRAQTPPSIPGGTAVNHDALKASWKVQVPASPNFFPVATGSRRDAAERERQEKHRKHTAQSGVLNPGAVVEDVSYTANASHAASSSYAASQLMKERDNFRQKSGFYTSSSNSLFGEQSNKSSASSKTGTPSNNMDAYSALPINDAFFGTAMHSASSDIDPQRDQSRPSEPDARLNSSLPSAPPREEESLQSHYPMENSKKSMRSAASYNR